MMKVRCRYLSCFDLIYSYVEKFELWELDEE